MRRCIAPTSTVPYVLRTVTSPVARSRTTSPDDAVRVVVPPAERTRTLPWVDSTRPPSASRSTVTLPYRLCS